MAFWKGKAGPVARAEEIYHRLWLGQSESELDARWDEAAAPYLEDALNELNELNMDARPRAWLADKLRRELSSDVRSQAALEIWDEDAERKARQLISDGYIAEALRVCVNARRDRLQIRSGSWKSTSCACSGS